MKTYKCPICGNTFESDHASKYCSSECKQTAKIINRKKWAEKSGFLERDRIYHQKKRDAERVEREKTISEKQKLDMERSRKEHETARQQKETELSDKALNGDILANLEIEQRKGNLNPLYWKWFKEYEISYAQSTGSISKVCVNGFSVYDDYFEYNVTDSIKAKGYVELIRV